MGTDEDKFNITKPLKYHCPRFTDEESEVQCCFAHMTETVQYLSFCV